MGVHFRDIHLMRVARVPLCECVSMFSVCLSSQHGWCASVVLAVAANVYPSFPVCPTCLTDIVRCSCPRDVHVHSRTRGRATSSNSTFRGTEGGVGHGNVSSVGSSGEGSGDVVMAASAARAFSTSPRGGTRGADLVAGDGTGRGDRARARRSVYRTNPSQDSPPLRRPGH